MKVGRFASCGRNSRAKVVFPAPFGPAMMIMCFIGLKVAEPECRLMTAVSCFIPLGRLGFGAEDARRRGAWRGASGPVFSREARAENTTLTSWAKFAGS